MIVPIFLFSGLTNYGTQTLATIHVAQFIFFCTNIIVCLSILSSVSLASITRKCCHLPYGPPSTALSVRIFNLLQSSKINRIVVDCFYFTQAITLCSLVYSNNNLQCLRASPSTPVITIGSNSSQYMNVAVPILKLFSIVTCYTTIIVDL